MSDYGDFCREMREAKRNARSLHGVECPVCREKRPKANASILLPEQRCRVDGYRDPRTRTDDKSYLKRTLPKSEPTWDIEL
jgi:hypothetical protein